MLPTYLLRIPVLRELETNFIHSFDLVMLESIFPVVLGLVIGFASVASGHGTSCTKSLGAGTASASAPFWLQSIKHQGISAYNANPSSYKVFRNVKDFGAKGKLRDY